MEVPPGWQPKVILASYLLFEYEQQPVFEIKWQQARGRHQAGRILDKIAARLGKDDRLEPWDLPDQLQQTLDAFTATGFRLTVGSRRHHGIILYCSSCGRTSLLQFYDHPLNDRATLCRLLDTFTDHPPGDRQLWSIFDICASLPVQADLQSHEFVPGRYVLRFRLHSSDIFLYRFKPAKILLQSQTMESLGASLADCGAPVHRGSDGVTWWRRSRGAARLASWLRRQPAWCWLNLRHIPEYNVIMGVRGEGRGKCDREGLESISRSFAPLRPE